MNKLAKILKINDDELFALFKSSLKQDIKTWDYFVNWIKVLKNIEQIETELNILNTLIGKDDIQNRLKKLILEHPTIVKAFPILLAIREQSVKVLIDTDNFLYKNFDFTPSKAQADKLADFIIDSGFEELLKNKTIKNLVDYTTGIEVGIQTNARKNRTGQLMESIVEKFIIKTCEQINCEYIVQATKRRIYDKWGLDIKIDKSNRRIDFAINKNNKLFFIETNFYAGGGSKLKSTAGEYIHIAEYWNSQDIEFIWITDGYGWNTAFPPLREYFDKGYFLLNLEMLKQNMLTMILKDDA